MATAKGCLNKTRMRRVSMDIYIFINIGGYMTNKKFFKTIDSQDGISSLRAGEGAVDLLVSI